MKVFDTIIYIVSFLKQYVILKIILQSEQPKKHMVTIEVDQWLSTSDLYEHMGLKNIKKL